MDYGYRERWEGQSQAAKKLRELFPSCSSALDTVAGSRLRDSKHRWRANMCWGANSNFQMYRGSKKGRQDDGVSDGTRNGSDF